MSTHVVKIVEIGEIKPHDNAERLEIIPVGGWQAVARKGQFKAGDRAVYIEPDYVVPLSRPEFAFLAKDGRETHRLKAVRLRGALSFGLLIEVPDALAHKTVGDDVMADLGIERWQPPTRPYSGGDDHELPEELAPRAYAPKFDIENMLNFPALIAPDERVVVTEKIDGGNARYVVVNDALFMGSRNRWLRADRDHAWSRALAATPAIESWCRAHAGVVLYGEVYGPVQALKYGLSEPRFIAFAALRPDGGWIDLGEMIASCGQHLVPTVPVLFTGPFDMTVIKRLAEEDSRIGPKGHLMEGVVIVPETERRDPDIGRVALKYISNRYWTS